MKIEARTKNSGRWPLLAVGVAMLISCGGGSDGDAPLSGAAPALSVANLTTAKDVLGLPLVQSGTSRYADVRIGLGDDGMFRVLSWRSAESSDGAPDATLDPPVTLAQLASYAQPVTLDVRRVHLDDDVFGSVRIEFNQGRWRYLAAPVPVRALTTQDLSANAGLYASEDRVVVMTSAPGRVEQFPLRLETRSYRFCMDPQDEGADSVTLTAPDGSTVLTLRAGGDCAAVDIAQGLYQVRQSYGGTGSTRAIFLHKVAPPTTVSAAPPAALPEEYLGITATLLDRRTHQPVDKPLFLAYDGAAASGGCLGEVRGVVQPTTTVSLIAGNRSLFDALNFFRPTRDSGSGALLALGGALSCTLPAKFDLLTLRSGAAGPMRALVASDDFELLIAARGPITVANYAASSNTFGLKGAFPSGAGSPFDGTTVALGKPSDDGTYVEMYPLQGGQAAAYMVEYRVVLRYRPGGFPGSSLPANGQVALFNSADCSGPAMVVDQYDLPGMLPGPLGNFNGSVLLGVSTGADVYEGPLYRGASRHLVTSGCIAPGTGFKPASIRLQATTVDMVFSTKTCEQCNLSSMDLAGKDLRNAKLFGSNLNNANLSRANLAGADLRQAFLQGAQLPNANLDAANLCGARLNAAPSTAGSSNVAANLAGAFLRNANLSRSNVAGVNFNAANFYSASQSACAISACDSYTKPVCASAAGATLDGAQFTNAYLVGVDMADAHGTGAVFSNAVLTGARFNNAVLTPLNGVPVNFSNAFIQGTDFTSASLANAIFSNAYDAKTNGCMQFELDEQHTSFPGFAVPVTPDSPQCVAASAPAKTCVKFTFTHATLLPASVVLPTPTVPLSEAVPKNSASCTVAPLCGVPFPSDRVNTCW